MVSGWCGDKPPCPREGFSQPEKEPHIKQYRIDLSAPLPAGLVDQIKDRFALTDVRLRHDEFVIRTGVFDQPALRALLDLIWDVGAELRSITEDTTSGPSAPDDARRES